MFTTNAQPLHIFVAAIHATGQPDRALALAQQNPGDRPAPIEGWLGYILAGNAG